MTVRLSLPSENTGSERLTGSLIASSARAISCRGMPREAAISSSVGSRPVSAVLLAPVAPPRFPLLSEAFASAAGQAVPDPVPEAARPFVALRFAVAGRTGTGGR